MIDKLKLLVLNSIGFGIIFYLFQACEEVPPPVNLNPEPLDTSLVDTSYISSQDATPQEKHVLIEDFTGVNCPNCPKAADKIEELQTTYPGKVIAVSFHPEGFSFTEPFPGHYDFRTEEGTQLYELLGQSPGLPAGAVDRVKYPSEERILINFNSWPSYVSDRLKLTSPVRINVYSAYNKDSSDFARIRIKIHCTEAINGKLYVSALLMENDIVDWQIFPFGVIDSHYVHKHIFRSFFTGYSGDLLKENCEKNRVFIKEYKTKVNKSWIASNCQVVVFVHRKEQDNFEVLQTIEENLM